MAARRVDTHELLKANMFTADEAYNPGGGYQHFEVNRPRPDGYGVSDQYVLLDSFLKLRSSSMENGTLAWSLRLQGSTDGVSVGVRDTLDNVIEVQVAPFAFPLVPDVPYVLGPLPGSPAALVQNNTSAPGQPPTLVPVAPPFGQYPAAALYPPATTASPWPYNPLGQAPCGGRVTAFLAEGGLQSFSDAQGRRHHFEFALQPGADPATLVAAPAERWDRYVFTEPLQSLGSATLTFYGVDAPVRFLPDCLYDTAAANAGGFLGFAFPGHGLAAGDRVFFGGFTSTDPVLNRYVNRAEGHAVGGDPALPPLPPGAPVPGPTFFTDPAVNIGALSLAGVIGTTYVAKRRLRVPLRFRRAVARLTNYIVAV